MGMLSAANAGVTGLRCCGSSAGIACVMCSACCCSLLQAVEEHTQALRSWLYEQLSSLQHSNGTPLLQVYGRHAQEQQQQGGQVLQGAIFNFQVLQPDGSPLSFSRVERQAAAAGIDLRSGCVCNPGTKIRCVRVTQGCLLVPQ